MARGILETAERERQDKTEYWPSDLQQGAALERIAKALERIAAALEKAPDTGAMITVATQSEPVTAPRGRHDHTNALRAPVRPANFGDLSLEDRVAWCQEHGEHTMGMEFLLKPEQGPGE